MSRVEEVLYRAAESCNPHHVGWWHPLQECFGPDLCSSAAKVCAVVYRLPHQLCGGIPRPDGGGAEHGEGARQRGCHTGDAAHQRLPCEGKHNPLKRQGSTFQIATTNVVLVRGMVWRLHSKGRLPI